jgi:hypothetical protein
MVKKVLYKQSPRAVPLSIPLPELKNLILQDRLPPEAMIRDQSLTSGKWRNVDHLAMFRRIKLVHEYRYGDMIENVYRLGSLKKLAAATGALAVTRLYVLSPHQNERICTVEFFRQGNVIETAIGASCLFDSFGGAFGGEGDEERAGYTEFEPNDIRYSKKTIYREQMPDLMRDWSAFKALLGSVGSCSSNLSGCLECRHILLESTSESIQDVIWRNPLDASHPQQSTIVSAYFNIAPEIKPDK